MPIRWRWPPLSSCGKRRGTPGLQPHHLEQRGGPPRRAPPRAERWKRSGSARLVPTLMRGLSERERVLEDDLHPPPQARSAARSSAAGRRPSKPHRSRRSARPGAGSGGRCRLAAAALADQARASRRGSSVKVDAVDRADVGALRPRRRAPPGTAFVSPVTSSSSPACVSWPAPPDGRRRDARSPICAQRRLLAAQRSTAWAQRGRKRQPGGRSIRFGGAPAIGCSAARADPRAARATQQAPGVGMRRARAKMRATSAILDDRGRHTSRRPGRPCRRRRRDRG